MFLIWYYFSCLSLFSCEQYLPFRLNCLFNPSLPFTDAVHCWSCLRVCLSCLKRMFLKACMHLFLFLSICSSEVHRFNHRQAEVMHAKSLCCGWKFLGTSWFFTLNCPIHLIYCVCALALQLKQNNKNKTPQITFIISCWRARKN